MVDTIESVSTKHGTAIPPIVMVRCGQAAITEFVSEQTRPPPELWLSSSGVESFLIAASGEAAYQWWEQHGRMAEKVPELSHHHIPSCSDRVADTFYK